MNKRFKPYRLINASQIQTLTHYFKTAFDSWSALYTLSSGTFHLLKAGIPAETGLGIYNSKAQLFAFCQRDICQRLQKLVFGHNCCCFQKASEQLLFELMSGLFQDKNISVQEEHLETKEWFYTGSPCLELRLAFEQAEISIYCHPHWVTEQLPLNSSAVSLSPIENSLQSEQLELEVRLSPFIMNFSDLQALKPGDVIRTDHSQQKALQLTHQQTILCSVHPGQNQTYKSIQIAST
ncbi:Surface presentation of antigens (SPOA) [Legionella birminghamensis]|uniref:Flagellar motor switch protein n=1 Tax=Legionella birminghamensis TaxID=28083 RepID=A0A378I876_9GAMM|nr:FliM/FliN family flagellar motor switch protein [Legionella birminghamensis]KTC68312.1 Surface presentation of antigens (SPOA) [Legionella birminghamensis]STX30975.1 Flagellar motor switch protein [Legionella birminghamensis]